MKLMNMLFHADGFDQDISQDDRTQDVVEIAIERPISVAILAATIQQFDP
jgi:hypothetical protein